MACSFPEHVLFAIFLSIGLLESWAQNGRKTPAF
jgi:hypothetical protein